MNRTYLIDNLDKATDKAASAAIKNGTPIPDTKTSTWVGKTVIKKNKDGFYDIYSLYKNLLYKNISGFDVATIIAQRYTDNEFKTVDKVMNLESEYAKNRTNMMHYLHCMQGAKKRHDYTTMAILEDKFQLAEWRAKRAKNEITIFKRVK